MALSIKELVVVLFIATLVFKALRPLVQRFASDADLRRRRSVWYILTIAAFLSPNVVLFTLIAIPLLVFIGKKDSNPAAAYLFLYYIVPPYLWRVPMIGMSYLVYLTPALLISFCVLTPRALQILRDPVPVKGRQLARADIWLLAYVLLTAFYFVLPETSPGVLMTYSFTDALRRALELFLTLYVPYFVFSRSLVTYSAILDTLASFISAAAVMGAVGIFEASRQWLLYVELIGRFNGAAEYLVRDGHLRAMASSGQPLALAAILDLAFGFWLSVQQHVSARRTAILTLCLLLGGLYATHSIGPSMGVVVIFLAFSTLRPGASRALKVVTVTAAVGIAVLQLGDSSALTSHIPFVSSWEQNGDYLYRVRLFDRAKELIFAHPLLGDQRALLGMQHLRQGQGIIDLVNGYVVVLLGSGIVGLSLWLCFVATGFLRARVFSSQFRANNPQLGTLGVALMACTLGTMFLIVTNGSMDPTICILTGLSIAYARLRYPAESTLLGGLAIEPSTTPEAGGRFEPCV